MNQDQSFSLAENPPQLAALDFLWLEITKRCNLACVHCYSESAPSMPLLGEMKYDNWKAALEEGASAGCRGVQFIGGEPMMHPHLLKLVADAKSIGYNIIEVFTNGTLLDDSMLRSLRANDTRLAFSLYARRAEIHESITQRQGSFDKTVDAISRAVRSGFCVRVGIIAMEANQSEVEETKSFVRDIGVDHVGVDRVRGIGRGDGLVSHGDPFDELCGSCWQGKLCIDLNGNAFPCVFSRFNPVGNYLEMGLKPILQGEALSSFRAKSRQKQTQKQTIPQNHCSPDLRPCNPDCAPSCSPCIPDLRPTK